MPCFQAGFFCHVAEFSNENSKSTLHDVEMPQSCFFVVNLLRKKFFPLTNLTLSQIYLQITSENSKLLDWEEVSQF